MNGLVTEAQRGSLVSGISAGRFNVEIAEFHFIRSSTVRKVARLYHDPPASEGKNDDFDVKLFINYAYNIFVHSKLKWQYSSLKTLNNYKHVYLLNEEFYIQIVGPKEESLHIMIKDGDTVTLRT
ncbi:unnamed protein product [Lepeophtheirus salmonis]|uniref:(salmon louse) hypothetical protein n=1 Tax=Lepeophtheirus salmonis TaxID=72036 RepID=A0A7R8D4K0_LEPSM|nr:unnamed protein product [Lepeophtheirus salmonis]CAF2995344.1 unnamed protein product [Lepeophtheirus salmonis]